MQAQLIDDTTGKTILGLSDQKLAEDRSIAVPEEFTGTKTKNAYRLGWTLAQQAKEKSLTQAVFDRGGYRYHGRVKAVAEGARAGGLRF